ncbi:serine protease [Actinokineospora alba]|uniref:Serine protease n=1 Tax=Actinokineospora alba TaxID=504798 RepID=A0A1H0W2D1_9PSEU|nr:S8 family serine peptidase [Actinokineospora alba]TDP67779.1 serine protease [Actinokineospora alba]SDI71712.1 serine protease [Actinokineospora alba]SDP84685.1 serine protease [Actinokineospora alba]
MQRKTKKVLAAAVASITASTGVVIALSTGSATAADTAVAAADGTTRIIVGYKTSANAALSDVAAAQDASGRTTNKGKLLRRLSTGAALVDVGSADRASVESIVRSYRDDPAVAYVEPDLIVHAQAEPNDTEYAKQWDLYEATAGMNVPGAWTQSTGTGVTVAVIDTGYVAHSDLAAQVVPGYDFISDPNNAVDGNGRDADASDPGDGSMSSPCFLQPGRNSSWHGTHVAGTIAAQTNNGKGIAGIAYNAKIQPIRVLGKCGGSTSDIADAITWASGGTVSGVPANPTPAKVLNLSLGGQSSCLSTYQNAINGAVQRGSTVVIAAGNSNVDVSGFTPANCDNVVAVASSSRQGNRAFYSNFGAKIDVAAPGGEVRKESDPAGSITTPENGIWSTLNAGDQGPTAENYEPYMGTSMAAPHVAGVAALMVAKKSTLTPAEVESLLKANTRPLPGTCTGGCGSGLVDTAKTVNAVSGGGSTALSVVNPGNKTATVGTAIAPVQLSASGGTAPYTWSATGLPAGLSVNASTGAISGTPTTAGTSTVTATATDAAGKTGSTSFTWTVTTTPTGCPAQTNGTDVAIPDAGAAVTSTINVTCSGNASATSKVEVHIKHTWRGDLVIDLVAPDGTAYRLKSNSSSDSADNVDATYTVNLSGEARSGAWKLRVRDVEYFDRGTIDSWTLTL